MSKAPRRTDTVGRLRARVIRRGLPIHSRRRILRRRDRIRRQGPRLVRPFQGRLCRVPRCRCQIIRHLHRSRRRRDPTRDAGRAGMGV